jgi:hypothetical protein
MTLQEIFARIELKRDLQKLAQAIATRLREVAVKLCGSYSRRAHVMLQALEARRVPPNKRRPF